MGWFLLAVIVFIGFASIVAVSNQQGKSRIRQTRRPRSGINSGGGDFGGGNFNFGDFNFGGGDSGGGCDSSGSDSGGGCDFGGGDSGGGCDSGNIMD